MNDKQELELVNGFRRLCPADKNMMITAMSMAISAEDAIRRELSQSAACVNCGQGSAKNKKRGAARQGA